MQEQINPTLHSDTDFREQGKAHQHCRDWNMTTSKRHIIAVLFILLLSFTETVYANAGTGFFFAGILHVLIGNIAIGLLEAFFIRRVFKMFVSYGIIILANYASSFLGYVIGLAVAGNADLLSLSALPEWLALLFLVSVLVEWPFFGWATTKGSFKFSAASFKHALSKSTFKYSVYAQCVSYALLVPYYFLTFDEGRLSPKDAVENQINNLGSYAYQYRIRFGLYGGGGGSYKGFSIPDRSSFDTFGRYAATVTKNSIVFVAADTGGRRTLASVILDSVGILHSWRYSFAPGDSASRENAPRRLEYLAGLAREYRMRPFLSRGRGGSYLGFSIPGKLSSDRFARYAAPVISTDSIVFAAFSTRDSTVRMTVVLDSTGRLCSWEYRGDFQ